MEKEIIIGRRRGADRICPNVPDEGMSKTAKLGCESEDKQIRFASPEGRIRADSSEGWKPESESKSLICERGWFFL